MKLAEALRERKQLQIKMGTLRQKLIDNAIYQEGSKPVEMCIRDRFHREFLFHDVLDAALS